MIHLMTNARIKKKQTVSENMDLRNGKDNMTLINCQSARARPINNNRTLLIEGTEAYNLITYVYTYYIGMPI